MDPSRIFVEERALDRPGIVEMGTLTIVSP